MRIAISTATIAALLSLAGGCALDRTTVRGEPGAPHDASIELDAALERDARVELDASLPPRDAVVPSDAPPPPPDASPCDPRPPDDVLHASPAGTIAIDGALDDWATATFVPVTVWSGGGTPGAGDLSATIAAAWSEDALFIAIEVRDDQHDNDRTPTSQLWQGDSIQIAFDVAVNATSAGYDATDDFEYGWASIRGATVRHRWVAPAGASPPADTASVVRAGEQTRYEIRLAAAELRLASLSSGLRTRMSMIVNEADGGPREGFLEWGSGIGNSKDPRLFRDLVLGARLCEP